MDSTNSNVRLACSQAKATELRLEFEASKIEDKYNCAVSGVSAEYRRENDECLINKIRAKFPIYLSLLNMNIQESSMLEESIAGFEKSQKQNVEFRKKLQTNVNQISQHSSVLHNLQIRINQLIKGDFSGMNCDLLNRASDDADGGSDSGGGGSSGVSDVSSANAARDTNELLGFNILSNTFNVLSNRFNILSNRFDINITIVTRKN